MNPIECVGYIPSLGLLNRLSQAGYTAPWEMMDAPFEAFVQGLPKGAKEELDRIDRALHAGSDLSEMVRFHPDTVRQQDPVAWTRLKGVGPQDHLFIYKAGHSDEEIRPGDMVEISERRVSKARKGIVSREVMAADIDWIDGKWVYAPFLCRNHDASVHDFLVSYALQHGFVVPEEVTQEYHLR